MGFSVHRGPFWGSGGASFTVKERSVNGTLRAPLLGTLKAMKNLLRKAFEMEHLSLYRGSVRETWREGSYTEDSMRHLMESCGNGAFLL